MNAMTNIEIARLMITSGMKQVEQEIKGYVQLIRDEAAWKLETSTVVSPSTFLDLAQRLADAVARQESLKSQLNLLELLSK